MLSIKDERLRMLDGYLARAGLSRQDLAHRLGHPSTTFSSWLRGTHPSPPDLWQRIADALEISSDVFGLPPVTNAGPSDPE